MHWGRFLYYIDFVRFHSALGMNILSFVPPFLPPSVAPVSLPHAHSINGSIRFEKKKNRTNIVSSADCRRLLLFRYHSIWMMIMLSAHAMSKHIGIGNSSIWWSSKFGCVSTSSHCVRKICYTLRHWPTFVGLSRRCMCLCPCACALLAVWLLCLAVINIHYSAVEQF